MEEQTTSPEPVKPPKNVTYAIGLLFSSLYLGLAPGFACKFLTGTNVIPNAWALIAIILMYAALWLFLYLLTKGAKWIRTIFLVFYFIGLAVSVYTLIYYFLITPIAGLLFLLQTAVQILAVILLLTPESNRWYKEQTELMHY